MATLLSSLSSDQQLELVYVGYFNRAAEPPGFVFWEGQYASATAGGQSATNAINNIANSFATQQETAALYPLLAQPNPNLSGPVAQAEVANFVQSVYQNLFNRAPDGSASDPTTGFGYWVKQITTGAVGLGQAILDIANGAQAGSADYQLLQNKVSTALSFTTQTAQAGLGLTEPMSSGYSAEAHYVITLDTSASGTAGTQAASTEISNFVQGNGQNSGSGGGQTFTLTPGTDNFVTGHGNDTYIGSTVFNQSSGTFLAGLSTGDTIKDSGTGNTLVDVSTIANAANGVTIQGVQNYSLQAIGGVITIDAAGGATANITGLANVSVSNSAGNGVQIGAAGAGNGVGSTLNSVTLTNNTDFVNLFVSAAKIATGATLTVNANGTGTATTDQFLNVTPDAGTAGSAAGYTNWNVNLNGGSDFLGLASNLNDGSGAVAGAKTLTFAGSANGQIDQTFFGGDASFTKVTTISLAGESGNVVISGAAAGQYTEHGGAGLLKGNTVLTSYTGGSGTDIVDLSSMSTPQLAAMTTLNGGTGTGETVILNHASITAATGSAITPLTNFQYVGDAGGGAGTITMGNFPGATGVALFGSETGAITVAGAGSTFNFNLNQFTANSGVTINGPTSGSNTLNIQVGTAGYGETAAATSADTGAITETGYGAVNISALGPTAAGTDTIGNLSITAGAGQPAALTVSGTQGLTLGTLTLSGNGTSITDTTAGALQFTGNVNATNISAASSGGLIMANGFDTSITGTAGDVIAGSSTKLNILAGSNGNDVITLGAGGDSYVTEGGGDTISIATGHKATAIYLADGTLSAAGVFTAVADGITGTTTDNAQPGYFGVAPISVPFNSGTSTVTTVGGSTVIATQFNNGAATPAYGTSADQSVITGFTAGAGGDTVVFSAKEWSVAGAANGIGVVNADLATAVTTGAVTANTLNAVAVTSGGTITAAGANLIELTGQTFANAAAVAQALKTGTFGLTFAGAGTAGTLAHVLVGYQDASGNAHIADLAITEAASASAAAQTNIAGSDMVQMTGVSLASLTAANIHFVA